MLRKNWNSYVHMGQSNDIKLFDRYEVDEFEVFVYKRLEIKDDKIKIFLSGIWFIKSLEVAGIQII